MQRRRSRSTACAKAMLGALVAWAVLAAGRPAIAAAGDASESVAGFYRSKTVTLIVGYSPGGGYDLYARLLARHLGRHIPGNPTVIVQNMPGGGTIVAANYVYNVAPKDGTVIGLFFAGLPVEKLIGNPAARFEPTRFNWIGSMTEDTYVLVLRTDAAVKRFEDAFTTPARLGSSGVGAENDLFPRFLNGTIGTRFDIVAGYPGSNEIDLAIERGEVEGRFNFWSSVKSRKPEWIAPGKPLVNVLVQIGSTRHPDLPQVPLVYEFARDEQMRQLFEVFFSRLTMARPFAAPPGVPAERVAALRRAFSETLRDPQFQEEAAKSKVTIENPLSGEAVQQLVGRIAKTPPEQVQLLASLLRGK